MKTLLMPMSHQINPKLPKIILVVRYGLVWDHLRNTPYVPFYGNLKRYLRSFQTLKQQLMIQIHGIGQYGILTTWR